MQIAGECERVTVFVHLPLSQAMVANGGVGAPGFLVDGFPRNKDNLDGWRREMATKTNVAFVLFIKCDPDVSDTVGGAFSSDLRATVSAAWRNVGAR